MQSWAPIADGVIAVHNLLPTRSFCSAVRGVEAPTHCRHPPACSHRVFAAVAVPITHRL